MRGLARTHALPTVALALGLGAASCLQAPLSPPPAAPAHESPDIRVDRTLVAQWYLSTRPEASPRIECLADLPDSLQAHGVVIQAVPGSEFRLDRTSWVRTKLANRAAYLKPMGPIALTEMPDTLTTFMGLADDSLAVEVLDSKLWLEALTGVPCLTFAYADHEHDRRSMQYMEACGYLAARDGQPSRYPWGSSLLGPYWDSIWLRSWERCSLWELPLLLLCADVEAQDSAAVAAWLEDPARLPLWKQDNSWVNLYTHTDDPSQTSTPILDAAHVAALLDALLADGDVWIAPVGEVAAYLRMTHAPEIAEPLVWDPDVPTSVGERGGPWHGYACAFSFSTDDGFKSNLHHYAPLFAARGLAFTAYLNPGKILIADSGYPAYMTSAEVQELAAMGIEIGNHGMVHRRVLSDLACTARAGSEQAGNLWLEIAHEGGLAVLRLTASR